MTIPVCYWSWFRDITGVAREDYELPAGTPLSGLLHQIHLRHPRLAEARQATLLAVGLEYQPASYLLQESDEVSLFPPVQGG